ncbi:MAG: thiamine-phosphate kinase, partial [Elusimicrobia bacterium]|nr:thiamine-phosphate kinase [Elusimicrobiota bacterium]
SLVDCVSILCRASGVGAEVELEWLPLSPAFRRNFSVREAATGGEDYSLLFAADPAAVRRLERLLRFSVIGRLTSPGKGVRFRENGRDAAISRLFEHFS